VKRVPPIAPVLPCLAQKALYGGQVTVASLGAQPGAAAAVAYALGIVEHQCGHLLSPRASARKHLTFAEFAP